MAVSWRRAALPAAVLGILVPAGFGAQALLSGAVDPLGRDAAASRPRSGASAPAFAGAETAEGDAVVAQPTAKPDRRVHASSVRIASYDQRQRRAVLTTTGKEPVRTGDVVASAPNRSAPTGALFKVAEVTGTSGGEVTVTTAPATLPELLGDRTVNQRAAVAADRLRVKPLSSGVTATTGRPADASRTPAAPRPESTGRGTATPSPALPDASASASPSASATASASASATPHGTADGASQAASERAGAAFGAPAAGASTGAPATDSAPAPAPESSGLPRDAATPLTTLRLGLDVPLPAGIEATDRSPARLAGEVRFTPEVFFQYEKRAGLSVLPERAAVGLGGSYGYDWQVHGKVTRAVDSGEITTPLASVTGQHTFWVGPVPVVVNTEVVFVYRFTADGRIVLDAEQRTAGSFDIGARYDRKEGWQPVRHAEQRTEGGKPRVEGAATAKATVGARASVSLYDTAGVSGELSVQLTGRAAAATGAAPAWELTAGYDLRTELMLQLKIFGIRIVDLRTTPYTLHGERRLFGQGTLPPV
ncbi:hypothetical protein J7E91_23735 [Streptomyces sp. ISL-99]|uniref:hypothetical protein n=1 Tax=Streptomyces sp. ISL-99 TaxID=2819193 RepID=UPI001BE7386A|nr:hypothetical protein [Streptomyces sp. ISL-99]MBT2528341.1 hypothetical protein [Streptomyces sp. ISL-99]